ncbi:hypothetical protein HZC00_03850 [Candidatus Kaiserbacteria bacterium]|nr:hypothetical protein [Candidatus Kaiserbacteria bacterium]
MTQMNQVRPLDTKPLLGSMGQISESELRAVIAASYCALLGLNLTLVVSPKYGIIFLWKKFD